MINRVVLVGRLTRDPELRRTGNGTAVTSFTLAIDNRLKDANGQYTTSFIPCVVWNQQAENCVRFIHKGSLVGIEGRLNQRTYQNKEGNNVQVIEVMCDSVQYLDPKKQEEPSQEAPTPTVETSKTKNVDVPDDDLPF